MNADALRQTVAGLMPSLRADLERRDDGIGLARLGEGAEEEHRVSVWPGRSPAAAPRTRRRARRW